MKLANFFSGKEWKLNLILFCVSFLIYFFYFPQVFLSPNSVLAGITGDALKNYYTFVFHIKNDSANLDFRGMNFPYGEHVVYTDCQPLLTFLLRMLPFTYEHLVGILHYFLFFSFILTPLILQKILLRLSVDRYAAFFVSLALTLLSPQFQKINGGHHGLAYGCFIPLSILLILKYFDQRSARHIYFLSAFNFLLYLIHPYIGFAASILAFISILVFEVANLKSPKFVVRLFNTVWTGLLPLAFFKLFMKLTDHHENRPTEPYGKNTLIENVDTLMAPDFGPFQGFMEKIFTHKIHHLEGHSYLGFVTVLLLVCFILTAPFLLKRIKYRKDVLALLFSGAILLFLSFGWHNKLLSALHFNSPSLNQFRATSRFAWSFYFILPIFLVSSFSAIQMSGPQKYRVLVRIVAVLYFIINLAEANAYFQKDKDAFWKYRNILSKNFLTAGEQQIINDINMSRSQAIISLPVFHLGSETFARIGADNSMIPAMFYSLHCNLPILGVSMSRTSITETKNALDLLNSYKKNRAAVKLLNEKNFVIIQSNDALWPDEERLLSEFQSRRQNDSMQIGYISKAQFLKPKVEKESMQLDARSSSVIDTGDVVFISNENRKPFLSTPLENYENIFKLDSSNSKTGSFVVSFHLHMENDKTFTPVNLIISKGEGASYRWEYEVPGRLISGFYDSFFVFEYAFQMEKGHRYEFTLKGGGAQTYHIRNFLLRPAHLTIKIIQKADTLVNNFPS